MAGSPRNRFYTVGHGQDMLVIAKRTGFRKWRTIYDHEKNADFRARNPNPYSLREGDQIWIPEYQVKYVTCETGKDYRFVVGTRKTLLHIELLDDDSEPYANKKYEVWLGDQKYGQDERRTAAEGIVEAEVPVVVEIDLKIWFEGDTGEPDTYTVQLGKLGPLDTVEGVQDRLTSLGYIVGAVDGRPGPGTQAAIKAFQSDNGLRVTGEIDEALRNKLKEAYGS